MKFKRTFTNMPKALVGWFEYDGLPVFRLNKTRRKYRNIFIKMINSGSILLEELKICPCGNSKFINISNKDRFGLLFRTMICRRCGLLITNPRIIEGFLPKYYKEVYQPLVVGIEKGKVADYLVSEHQGREIYNWCETLLSNTDKSHIKVLEIGCGSGANLIDFAKQAEENRGLKCDLFGTEYEEDAAGVARKNGIKMVEDNLDTIAKSKMKFDLIILSHVFEHFIDLNLFLQLIKNILTPGGFIYSEVPGLMNKEMLMKWYDNNFIDYIVHAHMYNFNMASLKYIFNLNGYELLKGDEFIRAIFALSKESECKVELPTSNCEEIISYLKGNFPESKRHPNSVSRLIKDYLWKFYYLYIQDRPDPLKYHPTYYNKT